MHPSFVVHSHIPKTAGSALNRHLLFPRYGEDGVYQLYRFVFERSHLLPKRHVSRAMRLHAAAGHVPYGYFKRQYPDALYLSIFRDPVERTLSFMNFVLNTPDHKVWDRLDRQVTEQAHQDPDAFVCAILQEPRLSVVQSNVQTRIAAGCARLGDRAMNSDDLSTALKHIAQPNYAVGDHRDLDGFSAALDARLGPALPNVRAAATGPVLEKRLPKLLTAASLKPRTLEAVAAANTLDLHLYERIAGVTQRRLAAAA